MSSTAVAVDVKRCRPFSFSLQITSQDELSVVYKYNTPATYSLLARSGVSNSLYKSASSSRALSDILNRQ
jgi:hypothetical protein